MLSLPLPPPLNLLYRYLKLHGTGERRSKDGFVVTNWEWNSGPSAQKAAYQPFLLSETLLHNFIIKYPQLTNKINGRYFRWPFVDEEGENSRSKKICGRVGKTPNNNTHTKKRTINIFPISKKHQIREPLLFPLFLMRVAFPRGGGGWFSRTLALLGLRYRTTRRLESCTSWAKPANFLWLQRCLKLILLNTNTQNTSLR